MADHLNEIPQYELDYDATFERVVGDHQDEKADVSTCAIPKSRTMLSSSLCNNCTITFTRRIVTATSVTCAAACSPRIPAADRSSVGDEVYNLRRDPQHACRQQQAVGVHDQLECNRRAPPFDASIVLMACATELSQSTTTAPWVLLPLNMLSCITPAHLVCFSCTTPAHLVCLQLPADRDAKITGLDTKRTFTI